MPVSTQRRGKSLTTFQVLGISWAWTGMFPAMWIMLETRSPFAAFLAYMITIVVNIPTLFSLIFLLTIMRCAVEIPIPNMVLAAVCGAVSAIAATMTIHTAVCG
ncbi:MAG: hypothetical protein ACK58L_05900 [Planctomycetota bacterium]